MPTSGLEQLDDRDTFKVPRRFFLAIFVFCLVGTGAELLLLEHFEGFWQKVPLILMLASLIALGWHFLNRRPASVRVFQGMMILLLTGGGAGLILHFLGNVEFEREMHPDAAGFRLFVDALMGATPALAPGTMMQLGLLGLAYTYRHPALVSRNLAVNKGEIK
ncbi:MAG: hypothetical protein ABI882_03345 [Acidobacteriota bacterium]